MKIRTLYKVKIGGGDEKKIIPPDQEIEVEDDIGWDLIAQGAATEANATEDVAPVAAEIQKTSEASEDETPIVEQILGIIPDLKPEDFTQAGHPRAEAVSIALGKDIRSDDAKEAWAQYQAKRAPQASQAPQESPK